MANIEELEKIELEKINDEISDLAELEKLILGGAKTKIPYIINYPFYNEQNKEIYYKEMSIKLQPLTSTEWNNARGFGLNSKTTVNLVAKAMYTKNEEPFPKKLVEAMPSGVIDTLFREVARISGVELNSDENKEMVKELMGFSK